MSHYINFDSQICVLIVSLNISAIRLDVIIILSLLRSKIQMSTNADNKQCCVIATDARFKST